MSWGLYSHNYTVVGPEGVAPEPPVGGAVEVVLDVAATINYGQHIRSMVRCDPASGKIMCAVGGSLADTLYFSSDNGENWTNVGWGGLTIGYPKDADSYVTEIDYDRLIDRWYMQIIDLGPRSSYYYYSDDDGSTWTAFTMGNSTVHALGLRVQDNGDLVAAGRNNVTNNGVFVKRAGVSGAVSEVVLETNTTCYGTTKVGSTHMVRTFGGGGGGTESLWTTADFSARSKYSTYAGYAAGFSLSDGTRAFIPKGTTATTTDAIKITPSTTFSAASTMEKQEFEYPLAARIRDIGVGAGWICVSGRNSNLNEFYAHYSANGEDWEESPLVFTTPADRLHAATGVGRLSYAGNNEWLYAYTTNAGRFMLVRFTLDTGAIAPIPPGLGGLHSVIDSMSPDIFYKLDDTGTPASVVDIGRKNYTNVVAQTITFGQNRLVDDGRTAALFGTGKIRATATDGAADHVHLFILSHDNTAAARLLLSYGDAFKLELAADHKLVFTAGAETLTSTAALAASTATLVLLSIENTGGKVNLYVQDGHQGFKAFTLTVPAVKSVVLGGQWNGVAYTGDADGVTVDYYAMIPFANADITALQDAWGVEAAPGDPPVLPDAPTSPAIGSTRLLVKADAAPVLRNYFNPALQQWQQVYGITNHATGAMDVHSGFQGGAGIVDLTDGKFGGGSLSIPTRSYLENYLPEREPVWTGFHGLNIGTRDFSLSMWVKPMTTNGITHLVSTQYARNRGGLWYIWGGFTLSLNSSRSQLQLEIGQAYEGPDFPTPVKPLIVLGFVLKAGSYLPGAWNFVTLTRRDQVFWGTVNGARFAKLVLPSGVSTTGGGGAERVPIHTDPALTKMILGGRLVPNMNTGSLGLESSAVKIDDVAFVADEAMYWNGFEPPTAPFGA